MTGSSDKLGHHLVDLAYGHLALVEGDAAEARAALDEADRILHEEPTDVTPDLRFAAETLRKTLSDA